MPDLTNSNRVQFKATYVPTHPANGPSPDTSRVVEKVSALRQLNLQSTDFEGLAKDPAVRQMTVDTEGIPDNPFGEVQSVPLLDLVKILVTDISSGTTQRYAPLLMRMSTIQLEAFGKAVVQERQAYADSLNSAVSAVTRAYARALPNKPIVQADAMRWGMKKNHPTLQNMQSLTKQYGANVLTDSSSLPGLVSDMVDQATAAVNSALSLVNGFLDRFKVEPVGRLHLERIEMTPVGIEHGELVHSVPLTPHETVNISHREWSTTTQTFENIVKDSFTGYSEQGVAEKTDLTQATTNESRQQSALDVNGSVSASYSGGGFSVTASAGVDYNTHSDDFRSTKDSIAHSTAVSRKASARTRKDHKTTFRVSSVAGAEDMAVRVLTNQTDNPMRVDYYQLMRKWRVDLIRYGLRMTYDIVVPNPGNDLSGKLLALRSLNKQISAEYAFDLDINKITADSWQDYAQQYGALVDSPPSDVQLMQSATLIRAIDQWGIGALMFDIPDGFVIKSGDFWAEVHVAKGDDHGQRPQIGIKGDGSSGQFPDLDGIWAISLTKASIIGRTGKVSLEYGYYNVSQGGIVASVQATPTEDTTKAWQVNTWNKFREADQAKHDASLRHWNDLKDQITKELEQFDALTLRKMEREEIMKSVLQWLFGPMFKLLPGALDAILDDTQSTVFEKQNNDAWAAIMLYGEFIKYIHNAIEWENVIFFPYPYFWDATSRWDFKRFLMHPDPEHRTFLRAGCARVVLTIRPGFETSFAQFMETYSFKSILGSNHPYVTIGTEIQNFAMTNYEGIPPANPDKSARPLLFPEQRLAWSDMQKLMLLLEEYNTQQHNNTTLTTKIAATGIQAANPSSMSGIAYGNFLTIDTDDNQETVKVLETTAGTFTADFSKIHAAGVAIQLDPERKMYPKKLDDLKSLVGTTPLPLTDPWGRQYVYSAPGLHGDYDLVCYGRDGKEGGEDIDGDITSWAEGSRVATWFEYTPTSALDVVIDSTLPTKPEPA